MKLLIVFFLLLQGILVAEQADMIVFSYDRPMQLYAFLESLYIHTTHIHETSVIYRCSSQDYLDAYEKVSSAFPHVKFIQQKEPPHDFQSLLLQEAFRPESANYVAFAVDDLIVTDWVDFNQCTQAMEKINAYGFYLRLGQNIDDGCSPHAFNVVPPLTQVEEGVYAWQFKTAKGNWAYPNTVDMTIYHKKTIEPAFKQASCFNPNTLEDIFSRAANFDLIGLCYATSRVVNIPMNIVSSSTATQHLNISAKTLLDQFNAGLKIDIAPLFQYNNRSAHIFDYIPSCLPR